ncbi:MAG: hypothetical protein JWO05_3132 [Gemmatimonadetes bacterium]|nr:hypothetical protein [Gemmatimonadota bacterium]
MSRVDVLVIGGGPAGLIAAREVASAAPSLDVVLLERDRAVGAPVRCGEGVGHAGMAEFIDPTGADWISRKITRVIFRAPDGSEVEVQSDPAYVLDRTRFEPALAAEAGQAGAEIRLSTEATSMQRVGDRWVVQTRGSRGDETIEARVVIGADGVECMVGRWAGIDVRVAARDMESCAQYVVQAVDFDPDAIYLHFGDEVAPGGYAWVFPKGERVANVGLGVVARGASGLSARQWLDRYMQAYFPTGITTSYTVGGVIVATTAKRIVADGIMLCGDAAHQVNPLSGGGITTGMKAARIAARTAVAALARDNVSADALSAYPREWHALLGADHERFYRVKSALERFDDGFYNRLAETIRGIPPAKRTVGRVFTHALISQPSLLPVLAKYFV